MLRKLILNHILYVQFVKLELDVLIKSTYVVRATSVASSYL